MRNVTLIGLTLCGAVVAASLAGSANAPQSADVIALERAALDRWGKGDPKGFLETYAPEITYFDPATQRRVDGHAAMTEYLLPITGKVKVARYEMIGPKV